MGTGRTWNFNAHELDTSGKFSLYSEEYNSLISPPSRLDEESSSSRKAGSSISDLLQDCDQPRPYTGGSETYSRSPGGLRQELSGCTMP